MQCQPGDVPAVVDKLRSYSQIHLIDNDMLPPCNSPQQKVNLVVLNLRKDNLHTRLASAFSSRSNRNADLHTLLCNGRSYLKDDLGTMVVICDAEMLHFLRPEMEKAPLGLHVVYSCLHGNFDLKPDDARVANYVEVRRAGAPKSLTSSLMFPNMGFVLLICSIRLKFLWLLDTRTHRSPT